VKTSLKKIEKIHYENLNDKEHGETEIVARKPFHNLEGTGFLPWCYAFSMAFCQIW
jgi:hypothetical protein